jgi:hypothetical protein
LEEKDDFGFLVEPSAKTLDCIEEDDTELRLRRPVEHGNSRFL